MTIASFAKPVLLGMALLGAASATLAIDSADSAPAGSAEVSVDLQASADAEAIAIETTGPTVEVVVAHESAANVDVDPQFDFQFADDSKVITRKQKKAIEAPVPPTAVNTYLTPDVIVPTPPAVEVPIMDPWKIRVPEPVSLKMHLQLAALETKVSQLQLESKKLEIAAIDAEGQEREKLLEQSRKKLLEAEAEKLQMQIERQQAQLKELEKALQQQAEAIKQQAEAFKHQAEGFDKQVRSEAQLAEAYARQTAEQAKAAAKEAAAHQVRAAHAAITYQPSPLASPAAAMSLQPGDQIRVEAMGVRPDKPISDVYVVEPMGTVAMGVGYGRVEVVGMSILEAEKAILEHLKKTFTDVEVQVTFAGRPLNVDRFIPAQNIPLDPQPAEKR